MFFTFIIRLFFFSSLQLLSLKAELLRKQEEVNKIKKPNVLDPFAARFSKHIPKSKKDKKKSEEKPPKTPSSERVKSGKQIEEDQEMLVKSKKILEAKAKLYDRMTNSGGSLNSDDTCLVQFNKKKQDDRQPIESSESDSDDHYNNESDQDDDGDGKWTEYTDCLGRTRKCLKEDVEFFKKKDRDLAETAKQRSNNQNDEIKKTPWIIDTKGDDTSVDLPVYKSTNDDDTMSMMSEASKMEKMRIQWETTELDNLNRDQIHYQDVLFDEARTHGVGYYGFSTDMDERRKQQKILEEEREKTLDEQKKREEVRLTREKIIADRVFAAKNRQRARLGLPALLREEFEESEKGNDKSEQKPEADQKQKKKDEKKLKKKEKLEKEREEKRQHHVRPWDHGKDGIDNVPSRSSAFDDDDDDDNVAEWKYEAEKPEPMSQEQWNELQRAQRNPDFAPPSTESFNRFTTIKSKHFASPPPPPSTESFNRFTTIKPKPIKRRNETAVNNMFNEPIRNELDGNDFPLDENDAANKRRRAEIAPPPTFDYYGPTSGSRPKVKSKNADLSDSIEAGLRFLREKSDKHGPGTKQAWVANTTYEE